MYRSDCLVLQKARSMNDEWGVMVILDVDSY